VKHLKRLVSLLAALLCVALVSSCSLVNAVFGPSDREISREKMALIVDALNAQDAAGLKGMFTDYVLREYEKEIDAGLEYLFDLFPNGDVEWDEEELGVYGSSRIARDGNRAELLPSHYHVTSGGIRYRLSFTDFTINTIDPDNIGIYALGAVLETEAGDSGPEVAFYDWGGVLHAIDKEKAPGIFVADDGELSRRAAAQIVDALNRQDADTLKGMFTDYARAEHSEALDKGLDYILGLFPGGDITWDERQGGTGVSESYDDDGGVTVMLRSFYRVSSGGVDYRLYFASFAQNPPHPENVGIYAMGAAPVAETLNTTPEAYLYTWADELDFEVDSPPGVYVPAEATADARMRQIADALESHDAAALEGLFSTHARDRATDLDGAMDYLFSLFSTDDITWTVHKIVPYNQAESGKKTEFVKATYRVSAGDEDYRLFFSDFTVNDLVNPDNVGLYALGVVPWTEDPVYGCVDPFFDWACSMSLDGSTEDGYAGIFVPDGD
jgi:hypothetical protein